MCVGEDVDVGGRGLRETLDETVLMLDNPGVVSSVLLGSGG